METDDAGLKVARHIREQAQNQHPYYLRTVSPAGTERTVIVNTILTTMSKTELTVKPFTAVMSSLRSIAILCRLTKAAMD